MWFRRFRSQVVAVTAVVAVGAIAALAAGCSSSTPATTSPRPVAVTWMSGDPVQGTPARYDKVGTIRVGPADAKNVLVLEPGTSAAAAYFVPLAEWIVSKASGWQVWAVERRESLLEDQSVLNEYKAGKVTTTQLYDYYLGYLKDPSISPHYQIVQDSTVEFAKQWGMAVAVQDLHRVIGAAEQLGGEVVLGGHSLGGSVVTAYATWDFGGKPGADGLAGLVYIDGGSGPPELTAGQATSTLAALEAPGTSPWLVFGGFPAPLAGLFNATGSASALLDPNGPSLGQSSGLLPTDLVPPTPVTNVGQYGYALNVATSPSSLAAAQAHLGQGIATAGSVHGWDGTGALTPITRFAAMFAGAGISGADGTEWYFPQRLTDDTGVVANGNANPGQQVLGVNATMGHSLPKGLRIYAFATSLGKQAVIDAARTLASQSGIPASNLVLVNRQTTYAHNDPAGAYPNNAFVAALVPFLGQIEAHG